MILQLSALAKEDLGCGKWSNKIKGNL